MALFYIFHAPVTPVIASNDVSIAAAVAGEYNLSEGVGAGVGLNLHDTAKGVKSQEGQPGEYLHLIVDKQILHQMDYLVTYLVKLPLPHIMIDLEVVCITFYIPKLSSIY